MAQLLSYEMVFGSDFVASQTYQGSFCISGGVPNHELMPSAYGIRKLVDVNLSAVDFKYAFRLSLVSDSSAFGTADFMFGVASYMSTEDTVGKYQPASALSAGLEGTYHVDGYFKYYDQTGSYNLLGDVIMFVNGIFNISLVTADNDQPVGGYTLGTKEIYSIQDISGTYMLYAIIDGILIKIDIIPDEVKAALMAAGVTFS